MNKNPPDKKRTSQMGVFRRTRNKPTIISLQTLSKLLLSVFLLAYLLFSSSLLQTTPTSPSLKIYVYDLPSRFNSAWLSNPRCSSHLFASEVALHHSILNSKLSTTNPYEADFFFVPVYVSCNFSTVNGFPAIGHARSLFSDAIALVAGEFPFWNRSSGGDHVFVASHDFGACFHAMEDVAVEDGIPGFLRNSILLQTFGVRGTHACQVAEHVVIPPYVVPEEVEGFPAPERIVRDWFVYFRGKMEVHPKNIWGRFYSKKVRTDIWRRYGLRTPKFHLYRKRYSNFHSEIARSIFCLCPLGWAPWSPRLVESVALGCVPVVIADGIRLPFPDAVPWPDISLSVGEHQIADLEQVLDHVARTNLSEIQRNLWDPKVRKALLYHRRIEEGDATWQVLRELEKKVDDRSWKRRESSDVDTV